jgi:benzoate/toluate 1,2-dioxygenase beta subunit
MTVAYQRIVDFLYREARLLDDRQWDEWLTCYAPEAIYWMPAWDDDDQLTEDPQSEISLIYYPNREGLEDRIFRIRTERSSASMPEPRTNHHVNNVEILRESECSVDVRFNWHTLSHRYKETQTFFGTSFYTIDSSGDDLWILNKKVILKNDYIRQVIDIYHV